MQHYFSSKRDKKLELSTLVMVNSWGMILTKDSPFKKEDLAKLTQEFTSYIKTVIDLEKKICSAGASRHFESEKILLEQGSQQKDLWGGGVDLETKEIDFNSFINIRPKDNNTSNEIQDTNNRSRYKEFTQEFFKEIL